jgi:hypothetical protein
MSGVEAMSIKTACGNVVCQLVVTEYVCPLGIAVPFDFTDNNWIRGRWHFCSKLILAGSSARLRYA